MTGQAQILRQAFAPTGYPDNIDVPTIAKSDHKQSYTLDVLVVSMDGGDFSTRDSVRVWVSLAADSDCWDDHLGGVRRDGGAGSGSTTAVSGPGTVDEATAVCTWGRNGEVSAGK